MSNSKATHTTSYREITFSDSDVVNLDAWIAAGESHPEHGKPWLLHDAGFVLAVVFAENPQDAIDIAADADKLTQFEITEDEQADYVEQGEDGADKPWEECERIEWIGNYCKPHDLESLEYIELPNPPRLGFVAAFAAHQVTLEAERKDREIARQRRIEQAARDQAARDCAANSAEPDSRNSGNPAE